MNAVSVSRSERRYASLLVVALQFERGRVPGAMSHALVLVDKYAVLFDGDFFL